MHFLAWKCFNSILISLKFVPKGPINNIPALVQIMAWRLPGDKPLVEPMVVRLPTHICITRPQWVNDLLPCHLNQCFPSSNKPSGVHFNDILFIFYLLLIQENAFDNVCKMSTILFRLQCAYWGLAMKNCISDLSHCRFCSTPSHSLNQCLLICHSLIFPWTKWLPFRRWYFHIHFLEWKCMNLRFVCSGASLTNEFLPVIQNWW